MKRDQAWWWRLAVLAKMVEKSSNNKPGRTIMMKFAYLLQTLRGVSLGYNFELYNYGPYDSDVLSDLSQAATLDAIDSRTVTYPSGYGYEYTIADGYEDLCDRVKDDLVESESDINWIVKRFGEMNASQLEMYSTIIFANRETRRKKKPSTAIELARRVHQIKPHFSEKVIRDAVDELEEDELVELTDE